MERTAFLHPRQHLLIHKAAPFRTVRIPPLIHRENLHLLLWRLLMTRILHPQPYTIHLLKKNPDGSFSFRLVCFHLLYCVFLLFADPFPQLLDQVPDSSVANGLTAGIADHICADTIRSFCYCQGYLFCKVCGDQPDLFHLHRLIQQINISRFSILRLCPINSPGVFNFPIHGFD